MTDHTDDLIPPLCNPAHEREWLAQERAMQRERLHLDPLHDDARGRRYRLLARALREPLPDALPADFAVQLAARVAASAPQVANGNRFESALLFALGVSLASGAAIVTAIHGRAWLQPFADLMPALHAPTPGLLLALGGCLAASWLLGHWQPTGRPPAT